MNENSILLFADGHLEKIDSVSIKKNEESDELFYENKKINIVDKQSILHKKWKADYYEDGFDIEMFSKKMEVLSAFELSMYNGFYVKDNKLLFDFYKEKNEKFQYSSDNIKFINSVYCNDLSAIIKSALDLNENKPFELDKIFLGAIYKVTQQDIDWYLFSEINGSVHIFENDKQYKYFLKELKKGAFLLSDKIDEEFEGIFLDKSLVKEIHNTYINIDLNNPDLLRESIIVDSSLDNNNFAKKITVGDKIYWAIISSSLIRGVEVKSINDNMLTLNIKIAENNVISRSVFNKLLNNFQEAFQIVPDGQKIYLI